MRINNGLRGNGSDLFKWRLNIIKVNKRNGWTYICILLLKFNTFRSLLKSIWTCLNKTQLVPSDLCFWPTSLSRQIFVREKGPDIIFDSYWSSVISPNPFSLLIGSNLVTCAVTPSLQIVELAGVSGSLMVSAALLGRVDSTRWR